MDPGDADVGLLGVPCPNDPPPPPPPGDSFDPKLSLAGRNRARGGVPVGSPGDGDPVRFDPGIAILSRSLKMPSRRNGPEKSSGRVVSTVSATRMALHMPWMSLLFNTLDMSVDREPGEHTASMAPGWRYSAIAQYTFSIATRQATWIPGLIACWYTWMSGGSRLVATSRRSSGWDR
jgi:hypothetical protein